MTADSIADSSAPSALPFNGFTGDSVRLGAPVYPIVILTLVSILVSIVLTCVLMDFFLGADWSAVVPVGSVWRMGMAISVVAPTLICPVLTFQAGKLLRRLQQAHDKMEEMARRDALTGLLNRRGFHAEAQAFWASERAFERPVGVLMLDIDRFKSVNDTHGHDVGDLALVHVARILHDALDGSFGLLGRHGGEEFVALLPGADIDRAYAVAETLRAACENNALSLSNVRLPITVSIGIAAQTPGAASLHRLLVEADRGLYEAKHSGRNRVGGPARAEGAAAAITQAAA